MLTAPQPVVTAHLFSPLMDALTELLGGLRADQWNAATACPGWSVRDVVAHLLDGDIGQLSRERDGYQASLIQVATFDELVVALNDKNERWVREMRAVSTRVLVDQLALCGAQVAEYFSSIDGGAPGPTVSWAGPGPHPTWLHVAREFTERWHHQQQIREAVGAPLQTEPESFGAVLATFAHSFPVAFHDTVAPEGTTIHVDIEGEAGGKWTVARVEGEWALLTRADTPPSAWVTIDQFDAWRMFTHSLDPAQLRARAKLAGDRDLAAHVLDAVGIIG